MTRVRLTEAMVARLALRPDGTVTPPGCFGLRPLGGDWFGVVDAAKVATVGAACLRWGLTRSDLALGRRLQRRVG